MKSFLALAILALAFSRMPPSVKAGTRGATNFTVVLSGTNQVPPNNSPATGSGWFTLDGNVVNFAVGNFNYAIRPTSAGIYGPAHPGHNGRLIVGDLGWRIFPPEGVVYLGGLELTRAQVAQLKAGLWYVSVKSTAFPDGEIRGQILPDATQPVQTKPDESEPESAK